MLGKRIRRAFRRRFYLLVVPLAVRNRVARFRVVRWNRLVRELVREFRENIATVWARSMRDDAAQSSAFVSRLER